MDTLQILQSLGMGVSYTYSTAVYFLNSVLCDVEV